MMDLKGKKIWLTGGTSGIGLALLRMLLEKKAFVLVTGRNVKNLKELELAYPEQLECIYCDFDEPDALELIREKFMQKVDSLEYLILSAGVCEYIDVKDMDLDIYKRAIQVNFFSVVDCINFALPLLKKSQEKPLIAIISSLVTRLPFTRAEAYGASKAALNYFAQSLCIDLNNEIDVSIIQPGFVDTPLTRKNDFPMPFIVDQNYAAQEVLSVMDSRKPLHAFPKRFSFILKLFSFSPMLWKNISQRFLLRA